MFVRSSAEIGLEVKGRVLPLQPLPRLSTRWYLRGLKVTVTHYMCELEVLSNTTMAHDFPVTLQILQNCVTINSVVLVELQGKDLIPKGSAAVHFKGLAGDSTLLLILPRLMTMQLATDSVPASQLGIPVTAQLFCVTLPQEENTHFDSVTHI